MTARAIDEHLLNSLLGGFLISTLPVREQFIPRQWLHQLHPVPSTCEYAFSAKSRECLVEENKRDILLRNLLLGLLNPPLSGVLAEPPPLGPLPDLSEDLASSLQSPSSQWAIDLENTEVTEATVQPSTQKFSTPSEFLSLQPTPCNGGFCYAAVFSNISPKVSF